MSAEIVAPAEVIYERIGLQPARLIEATKTVNVRKVRHVHPVTGAETLYLNADDVVAVLDREYEATEDRAVGRLARLFRGLAGRA